jgi:multicomponent Na+:H+ antiporter subunit G
VTLGAAVLVLQVLLLTGAGVFFLAGTLALIRFPDAYSRIHALTKSDNVGLGLLALGLALGAESPMAAAGILLVWLIVLPVGSLVGYLIARHLLRGFAARDAHD